MITLVCRACHRPLRFGDNGWEHRDPDNNCTQIMVAWPPPTTADEPALHEA
jgi:hypothetical protein